VRSADGRLALVDIRPVNFEREDRDQLRWGFNFTKPIGPQPPRRGADGWRRGDGPPPGDGPRGGRGDGPGGGRWGGPGGGGGGRGFGGPRGGGGALQLALFHTWTFKDEILIRDGVPVLDLLDGSAAGSSGGTPRHQVDLQAGVTKNGLGARLEGQWRSATEVRGGAFGGEDLDFSDLTTVGLRLFADLGRQPFARNNPWLRGARASLSVENLFNQRQKVRAADGTTPINYQPDYLDPQGRTVRISFRKVFF
jgi:iron complex outermembrane receptor protein